MQSQRPQLVVAEGEKDEALGELKKMQKAPKLRQELSNVKESESPVSVLSADNERRILELEAEVERGAISELKMLDSLKQQTKVLEETKIELEETKLELVSLQKNVDKENVVHSTDEDGSLKTELLLARDQLAQALDNERIASMKTKSLKNELGLLNDELKKSISAEETSKNAMDELAIALKEVSKVSNLEKEKHQTILLELEHVKEESEQLKEMIRSTEERYQKRLDEAEKETEVFRNTADRLRLEAEESLLAWNGKEMGFVTCIKKIEEEKAILEQDKAELAEALEETETSTRSARDENIKLRDILRQAINEANAAKSAAGIASDENSVLKNSISERDEELLMLNKENKRLRINEDAAKANVKEEEENGQNEKTTAKLKSIIEHGVKDETEEEENEKTTAKLKPIVEHDVEDENKEEEEEENGGNQKTTAKLMSIIEHDVEDENEEEENEKTAAELKSISNVEHDLEDENKEEENGEKSSYSLDLDEMIDIDDQDSARNIIKLGDHLKGSIFDSDYHPKSEPPTPISVYNQQRVHPNPLIRVEGALHSEDHGNVDSHHQYHSDTDNRHNSKMTKKLFRRVSDIIMRKKIIPSHSMGSHHPKQM